MRDKRRNRMVSLLLAVVWVCLLMAPGLAQEAAEPWGGQATATPARATATPVRATAAPAQTTEALAWFTPTPMPEGLVNQQGVVTPSPVPSPTAAAPTVSVPAIEPTPTPQVAKSAADLQVEEYLEQAKGNATASEFEKGTGAGDYNADFYFESGLVLHGILSSISRYVYIPDYCKVEEAILCFSYTASDLILEDHSSLTFYLNGTPFYSCYVKVEQNSPMVMYLRVPVELFQKEYNVLEVASYVRLTDDTGCTDDFNNANWIKVEDVSCLRIGYSLAEDSDQLNYYPFPFVSLEDPTGQGCAVAVSDEALGDELAAALMVMAGLGDDIGETNDITLTRLSDVKADHIIYFGLRETTPAELLSLLEEDVPSTGAVVKRVSKEEKEYLLVISNQGEALMEAARLLGDASRIKQVRSRRADVSVGEAEQYRLSSQLNDLVLEGQYSFKEFLGHGLSFVGPFHRESTITLPVAKDYTLSSESKFTIKLRYSENLDFDRSLMSVYWGDSYVPLISRKLTKEGAAGETVTFTVPADLVGTYGQTLTIAFELEIKDMDCTPRQIRMPWAYVAEDSSVFLPQGEASSFHLGNWPAPFQRNGRLNDIMVIIPDEPMPEELALLGSTIAALGAGADPYGQMQVRRGSGLTAVDVEHNLVVVGYGKENAFLQQINDFLYFRFNQDMTAFESNDRQILTDAYAKNVGTVQLVKSPVNEAYAMLVVASPGREGIRELTEMMRSQKLRWGLTKEAVLVDRADKVVSYQFTTAQKASEQEAPSFIDVVASNKEPMIFALIGVGSMLLLLIGTLIVLIRIRKRKKNEE